MSKVLLACVFWICAFSNPVFAGGPSPSWVAEGSFFLGRPSALGASAAVSSLFKPLEDRDLLVGPKLGALCAWADNSRTRFDLYWGLSEVLWVVNAVGGGVDLEVVAPSTITNEESAVHFRVVPHLAVRLFRVGEDGAWSMRVATPYDTHYKWGVELGLTLQFNGVTQRGVGSDR
jgi:hypothetical protein